jgi:subtilase family serine protease
MDKPVRIAPLLSAALAVTMLVAAFAAPGASAGTVRVGSPPRLPRRARQSGRAAAGESLHLIVALRSGDPAGLDRFAAEVSTPGSPSYGQYLSVAGFAERFGASPEAIATVRGALEARGLRVGAPAANDLSLPVTTTVEGAEAAFDLTVDQVTLPDGSSAHVNDRAPALPAVAAPYVTDVSGLSSLPAAQPAALRRAPRVAREASGFGGDGALGQAAESTAAAPTAAVAAAAAPQPCARATEAGEEVEAGHKGWTADQIASAYGFTGLYQGGDFGAGQTVAVLEYEPVQGSDIARYQSCYGTHVPVTYEKIDGGAGEFAEKKEDGEAGLDIEQIIGLAPEAQVIDYEAPNEGDTEFAILEAWILQDKAKVMSSSWGSCEAETETAYDVRMEELLKEAATQGQSFFVAAGDAGPTECYGEEEGGEGNGELEQAKELTLDTPSDQPYATAVGGTRLEGIGVPRDEYIWNDGPGPGTGNGAGGGGISEVFAMPAYQAEAAPALGVTKGASGAPCGLTAGFCRENPDVSADSSVGTGYVIFTEGTWYPSGGTSASTPLWAALTALTDADPACGGHPVGFANPALYSLAGSAYATNFQDITAAVPGFLPTTGMFGEPQYPPESGYDMATGLGSPNGANLAASLCAGLNPPVIPPVTPENPPATNPPTTTAPPATPAPTGPAKPAKKPGALSHPALSGLPGGRPKLSFALTAGSGGALKSVTLKLPSGLAVGPTKELAHGLAVSAGGRLATKVSGSGGTLKITLTKAVSSATFQITAPTIVETPALTRRAKAKGGAKLKFSVATTETGGSGRYSFAVKP